MPRELANNLLNNFGELLGIEGVELGADDSATLSFDELDVCFAFESHRNQLVVFSEIGSLPSPDETSPSLLETLLQANLFRTGTNGATIGADRNGERKIVLSQHLDPRSTSSDCFFSIVENFVDTAESWQKKIPDLVGSEDASEDSNPIVSRESMIRI